MLLVPWYISYSICKSYQINLSLPLPCLDFLIFISDISLGWILLVPFGIFQVHGKEVQEAVPNLFADSKRNNNPATWLHVCPNLNDKIL